MAFAAAHRSDEDHQAYIYACRHALSVIAKAKAWQATCSSFSPKSNPKSVYFLLRSVAGSSFSSPNFPNCSSHWESALVFADYLRSHIFVSQPKTHIAKSEATFSSSSEPRALKNLIRLLVPLFLAEFLAASTNLSLSSATGQRQSCLPHAKALSSLWHRFSPTHFLSLPVFAFLSFPLEDIFHYSHPQDVKAFQLFCFLSAYLSYLLCLKVFGAHHYIASTLLSEA